jgi:RND family efflux transporter MFP subunit
MKPLSILPLAIALLAGCGRAPEQATTHAAALPPVRARVVTVKAESVVTTIDVTGTVRPIQRAQLAAKVMGTIEEMPFLLGQRVRQGDVLVKISAGEINARVVQAQSQLNAVQRDLQRERELLAKGASTADMVRGLEDRFTAAQAMVHEAEVMLGYATLRAPFDGLIARKLANAGDLASPGYPLLEIEGATGFEVEAGIPDSLAAGLSVGMAIEIEIGGAEGRASGASLPLISGTLTELSSAADPNAHTVTAKILLPANLSVRSGQFARVLVPGAAAPELLVPATAVTSVGQMERLFVADSNNRAVLRLIKSGARQGDRVEVLSGIDDGERIVVAAATELREGQPLEIAP